ncbi:unnamed protein product [Microthlaspi erraticum]|uniref:Uncharacterized protein n=1 Tax=Microthlaspi erraticum TaxID=1685480 RepID=A0A6D2ILX8_9BRAS|nr:unnamed protein product [Microthlaspi erraticum]
MMGALTCVAFESLPSLSKSLIVPLYEARYLTPQLGCATGGEKLSKKGLLAFILSGDCAMGQALLPLPIKLIKVINGVFTWQTDMIMEEVAKDLDQEAAGELEAEEQLVPEEALTIPTRQVTRSQTKLLNQGIGRVLSRLSRQDHELKHSTMVCLTAQHLG